MSLDRRSQLRGELQILRWWLRFVRAVSFQGTQREAKLCAGGRWSEEVSPPPWWSPHPPWNRRDEMFETDIEVVGSNLARYIKVMVEHYLLFMFSPPKISWVVSGINYICLHLLPVFYLIQPSDLKVVSSNLVPSDLQIDWQQLKIYVFSHIKADQIHQPNDCI